MRRPSLSKRSPSEWILLASGLSVLAVLVALTSYALLTYALARPVAIDVTAYWNAAERLRDGGTLYEARPANASDLYRYAPWFAAAWVPATLLPQHLVAAGWVGLMLAAALVSTLPLLARGPTGWAAFAIFAPLQLQGAVFGNVQPLLVLMLMWGVHRRSGPLWIAIGTSLKAAPLALVLVYAGRGEWRRVVVTLVLTAVLTGPMLLFDLRGYSVQSGPNQDSLAGVSLLLFVPIAIAAAGTAAVLARTRYAWAAGAFAIIAALPRMLSYQTSFMLVGLARDQGDTRGSRR